PTRAGARRNHAGDLSHHPGTHRSLPLPGVQPAHHALASAPPSRRPESLAGLPVVGTALHAGWTRGAVKKRQASPKNACPCENAARERLLALEAPLVVDHEPGLFLRDRGADQRHHAGPRAPVLDYPEHLAIGPVLVELRVGEVPRRGVQDRTGRAIALAARSMAIEAGAFAFVDRFPFRDVLRRFRDRVLHRL